MDERTGGGAGAAWEKLWLEVVEELTPDRESGGYTTLQVKRVRQDNKNVVVKAIPSPRKDVPYRTLRRKAFTFFRDPVSVVSGINKGIPIQVFNSALDHGLISQDEIRIVLAERTFRNRKKNNEPLTRDESDKFARMLQIMELASETFGTTERAHRWLRQPKRRFEGKTPMEMLETSMGAQAVEDMLIQIAHGIAA